MLSKGAHYRFKHVYQNGWTIHCLDNLILKLFTNYFLSSVNIFFSRNSAISSPRKCFVYSYNTITESQKNFSSADCEPLFGTSIFEDESFISSQWNTTDWREDK